MENIIGHKNNIKFLKKSIKNKKISHTYFFYGPMHIGKRLVVKLFSSMLLCENKSFCKKCKQCQQVLKENHPDLFWLKEKQEMNINNLRDVVDFFSLSSFSDSYKIVIIENAHYLKQASANSILKFLEEPPQKTIIIFISNNFYNILPTIRSRCQILRFSSPSKKEIKDNLKQRFKLEDKMIDAMTSLAMNRTNIINEFAVNPMAMNLFKDKIDKIIDFLINDKKGTKPGINDLDYLLVFVRFLILFKLDNSLIHKSLFSKEIKNLANKYTIKKLISVLDLITKTHSWVESNVNKKLAIDNILINL